MYEQRFDSELSQYYSHYGSRAGAGEFCRGPECGGWFLSQVDTWHQCGCGANKDRHPNDDPETNPDQPLAPEDVRFAVMIKLKSGWFARTLFTSPALAMKDAKATATALKEQVRVRRIATKEQLATAEFQVDKIEDWLSDMIA